MSRMPARTQDYLGSRDSHDHDLHSPMTALIASRWLSSRSIGQASSQVARWAFSCSTAAPVAASFQECAFPLGFSELAC